jgi:hypothetical protein
MHVVCNTTSGNATIVYLNPNNTSYNNAFTYMEYWITTGASGNGLETLSAFRIGWGVPVSTVFISNYTTFKTVRGLDGEYYFGANAIGICANIWNDTTTSWTSLGTITFPQATTGYVLVRRLA